MSALIILGVLLAISTILCLYGVVLYNGFVQMKNDIDKAWSNIDLLLKQRYDELPKLLKVCEGYMQHEQRTLEAVTRARSQLSSAGSGAEQLAAQNFLSETLRSLFAVTENYPELKADAGFRQFANRISEIEDQIADRRELYNEYVNIYNIRLDQLPDLIIARVCNFTPRKLWAIDAAHREDVKISFSPAKKGE
ncbi:MAG: LemA family protein [Desulfuromonadales bacterium]|nr:LemA family protein [Desulfuromonadales bacterium]